MSDEPKITAARLRIVADSDEPAAEALAKPRGRGRKPRIPRIEVDFAPVAIGHLYDRRYDPIHPPLTRLYYFIVFHSRRGADPFELTNAMAAKLGIDRHYKSQCLRKLEQHGLVLVARRGRATILAAAEA